MNLELHISSNPEAQQNLLYIGGGEQMIEIRALGLQGETRKDIRFLLQLTDRRAYKSPPGTYQQLESEKIIRPLDLWRVKEVFAEFNIARADRVTPENEWYLLDETGFRNGQPRDTILKFLGRDQPRDAKVSLSGFGKVSDTVILFVTAHPSVPINLPPRMHRLQQDDPNDLKYNNAQRHYQQWVASNEVSGTESDEPRTPLFE